MDVRYFVVATVVGSSVEEIKFFESEPEAREYKDGQPLGTTRSLYDCTLTISDDDIYEYALATFDNLVDTDNPPERD